MSNKKQTAVEWLVEEIYKWENGESIIPATEIVTKAKELEKQQIIDAWIDKRYLDRIPSIKKNEAERYYKETFNK